MGSAVQLNIFILLFGMLQGVLLLVALFKKKAYRAGYIFLIAYIFVMILQIVLKAMSKGWLMDNMTRLYLMSYALPFLYGPLVWLFAKRLLQQRKAQIKDFLHFIPFIVFALYVSVDRSFLYESGLLHPAINLEGRVVLQLVSITTYHLLAMQVWRHHQASAKNYYSNLQRFRFRWLQQFIVASFVLCVAIASVIYFMYVFYPVWNPVRFGFIGLTLFIYWVSYAAWTQPDLFSVVHGYGEGPPLIAPKLVVHHAPKKYANSTLDEEEALRIQRGMQSLLNEKIYLDAELTIDKLARMVTCTRHHLSQVLNEQMTMTFYDCINMHRVEEAKQLLLDPGKKDHKIAALAYDAGFNSLSTFNEVFKKSTGQTPSQFRKEREEELRRKRI